MSRTLTAAVSLVPMLSGLVAASGRAPESLSAAAAKELTTALTAHKLDAIAARDPDEADRFVAALFYPGGQLLVISARYSVPALLDARLAHKQYRDVYVDLSTSSIHDSRVFFVDMSADGLCASRGQIADTVEEGGGTPKVFDGDGAKQQLSEIDYQQRYADADRKYARLLRILLAQVTTST